MNALRIVACSLIVCLIVCLPVGGADAQGRVSGSFFAVIVSDIEESTSWYRDTLGLSVSTRMAREAQYDIVNLAGPGIFVELLELADAGERPSGRIEGVSKVGFLVDDLQAFVASLPKHVERPKILHDEPNNLLMVQLHDPDNQVVQVMQILVPVSAQR